MEYIITKISQEDVQNHRSDYNSNNHKINGMMPNDYFDVMKSSYAHHWMYLKQNVKKMSIDMKKHSWIKRANTIYNIKMSFPKMYQEEFDDCVKEYQKVVDELLDKSTKYFVRTDSVSLKYSEDGNVPFSDMKTILRSIITCIPKHTPTSEENDVMNLYFILWKDIDINKEFRV